MQFATCFGSFLVATIAASVASGSIIPKAPSAGSFEIKRSANPQFVGRDGATALLNVYRKFGVTAPRSLIMAADHQAAARHKLRRRSNDTIVATPIGSDTEYNVQVQIGTPAQTLSLDFDTGSSDLWVFSTGMNGSTNGHTLYDASSSSTAQRLDGASWHVTYGDESSSSGDVYIDTVSVGGLTFDQQAVEAATQVSSQFITSQGDGLLGLAFGSLNTIRPTAQKTFFENIGPSLDSNLFVADLRHNAPGSYVFGTIPSEATNIQWAPLDDSRGYWGFNPVSSLSSASDSSNASTPVNSFSAIADTGTTLLVLSDDETRAYYSQINSAQVDDNQGGWVFDCSTQLPDFTFQVSSNAQGSITVPGSLLNYGSIPNGKCFGGIQTMSGVSFAIYGDIALKAAYVIFDAGNRQIGWAQKA